ncbi:hypothetical protein NPIL_251871 [Nephila pilipes]|uniref:Uncharacterized protein n=1 Tax=Nephila pilipes TaxID=299642 RepID=A0A8X6UME8_NEPPI|nr:hypothetical protein NPIL_251871 [Nephila pilipes]
MVLSFADIPKTETNPYNLNVKDVTGERFLTGDENKKYLEIPQEHKQTLMRFEEWSFVRKRTNGYLHLNWRDLSKGISLLMVKGSEHNISRALIALNSYENWAFWSPPGGRREKHSRNSFKGNKFVLNFKPQSNDEKYLTEKFIQPFGCLNPPIGSSLCNAP